MIGAAILAGGQSKRFGSDKALAPSGPTSLLGRTIHLIRQLNLEPILLAPKERGYARLFSCVVLEDDHPGEGPLGALTTLWKRYPQDTFLILTCDMPGLTSESLLSLLMAHEADSTVTLYQNGSAVEPFPGIYQSAPSFATRRQLPAESRSMKGFLEKVERKKIVPWNGSGTIFSNVNFPADLSAA